MDSLYSCLLSVAAFGPTPTATSSADLARRELVTALCSGQLQLSVSRSLLLAEAAAAHTEIESRRTTGKIVPVPESPESNCLCCRMRSWR